MDATAVDNEGIRATRAPRCMLCRREGQVLFEGLRDQMYGAPGLWGLRRCGACELSWIDPRPLPEDIPKLYQQYHTHTSDSGALGVLGSLRNGTRDALLGALFGYRGLRTGPAHVVLGGLLACVGSGRDWAGGNVMWLPGSGKGRLLDVGCGSGRFLADMKALGWDAAGVEFDPKAAEVARTHYGLDVRPGSVHDAGFEPESFDAVTLSHVIEHLPDPVETLARCRQLLKPGGRLVMVTPNPGSLCRRIFGRDWRGWEVPRHLYVYSTDALRVCSVRAGLQVTSVFTTAKAAAWHWHAVRGGGAVRLARLARRAEAMLFGLFGSNFARVGRVGEEVVLIARRSS
jgi:SAM-dependent methyltransferase